MNRLRNVSPSGQSRAPQAIWVLIALVSLNVISIVDRYMLPSVQPLIKAEFRLSDRAVGSLSSAFFIGFMLASPTAGLLNAVFRRRTLTCGAALLWSFCTLCTAASRTFTGLLVNHTLVAVGEACFAVYAPVVLCDIFSESRLIRAFSIYALSMPMGTAAAFGLGATSTMHTWRFPFYLMSMIGGLAASLSFLLFPTQSSAHRIGGSVKPPLFRELSGLASNAGYSASLAGGIALSFSAVGIVVWLPTFLQRSSHLSLAQINIDLSVITIVSGVIGVSLGGLIAKRWQATNAGALYMVAALSLLGGAFFGVLVIFGPTALSLVAVAGAQVFFFLNAAPMAAAMMFSVNERLRAAALGLSMFLVHACGDGISPTFIGWVADKNGLRAGMGLALLPLPVGALVLLAVAKAAQRADLLKTQRI